MDAIRCKVVGPAGPPVVLLHGMLGDAANWDGVVPVLAGAGYRVLAPTLPMFELPVERSNVRGLLDAVLEFVDGAGLHTYHVVGNSLGGQIGLGVALARPRRVRSLVLTGSSGIREVDLGTTTLRRRDREFIRERAALTFHDPAVATDRLVDDVYAVINDHHRAIRLLRLARSASSESVASDLPKIVAPTLLVWGAQDRITPPDVARAFRDGLPRCEEPVWFEQCGHAPMMEYPERFAHVLVDFLGRQQALPDVA